MHMRKLYQAALDDGFTVDTTCYPWVAYKGERFNPAVWFYCYTQLESQAIELARAVREAPSLHGVGEVAKADFIYFRYLVTP